MLEGLGERIGAVADLYETRKSAAAAAGVSVDQLRLYITGGTKATFAALAGLALGKGVSLDWLATGRGEMKAGIDTSNSTQISLDPKLLQDTISAVEELLAEKGVELPTEKKARAIALTYELFAESGKVDKNRIGQIIQLAA